MYIIVDSECDIHISLCIVAHDFISLFNAFLHNKIRTISQIEHEEADRKLNYKNKK